MNSLALSPNVAIIILGILVWVNYLPRIATIASLHYGMGSFLAKTLYSTTNGFQFQANVVSVFSLTAMLIGSDSYAAQFNWKPQKQGLSKHLCECNKPTSLLCISNHSESLHRPFANAS